MLVKCFSKLKITSNRMNVLTQSQVYQMSEIEQRSFTNNFRCFSTSSAQGINIFINNEYLNIYEYLFNIFPELFFFILSKK